MFGPRKYVSGRNRDDHLHQTRVVIVINIRAEGGCKIVLDPKNSGGIPQELQDGETTKDKTKHQNGESTRLQVWDGESAKS